MAQRHSGYARKQAYCTPHWVTEALLPHIAALRNELGGARVQSVWEPACGAGHMAAVLSRQFKVIGTDIEGGIDFLRQDKPLFHFDAIITNPPWGKYGDHKEIGAKFVEQAIRLTEGNRGLVAMLFPHEYDTARGRRHLFADCPIFAKKIALTRRIVWFERDDGVAPAPSCNHAWFIWDWRHKGAPTLAYEPIEDLANDQLRQVA